MKYERMPANPANKAAAKNAEINRQTSSQIQQAKGKGNKGNNREWDNRIFQFVRGIG